MGFSRQEYWSGVPLCTKFKWKLKTRRKVTHRIKHKSFCQPENNIITVVSKSHPFSLYGDWEQCQPARKALVTNWVIPAHYPSAPGDAGRGEIISPLPRCTRRCWSGRNHQPITPMHQATLVGEESSEHKREVGALRNHLGYFSINKYFHWLKKGFRSGDLESKQL